ncbi:MAG: TadE/TadG family type IV pilus assembly protein [Alphaproteobacteria bacterium]
MRDQGGNVAIEAAILLPVLLTMLVLGADLVRYLDTVARMDRVAATVADLVARSDTVIDRTDFTAPVANNDLATFLRAGNEAAHPDDLAGRGKVWVSAVRPRAGGGFELMWQRTGPYEFEASSRLEVLPELPTTGTFIVAEVIFAYEPLLLDTLGVEAFTPLVYRRAIFRPRLTALSTLEDPEPF